jgi:FkbM family methyltransferase
MNIIEYILQKKLKTIFEIGVGNPNICRTRHLMGSSNVNLFLFEANPYTFKNIQQAFQNYNNVELYNFAIFDRDGEIIFCEDGDSSYVDEIISPTKHNVPSIAETKTKLTIPCKHIKFFDKGNIDAILIDTEGCEWKIIKGMISRPKIIVLETNNPDDHGNGSYNTPDLDLIEKWMDENKYSLIYKDITDSYYEKQ